MLTEEYFKKKDKHRKRTDQLERKHMKKTNQQKTNFSKLTAIEDKHSTITLYVSVFG